MHLIAFIWAVLISLIVNICAIALCGVWIAMKCVGRIFWFANDLWKQTGNRP